MKKQNYILLLSKYKLELMGLAAIFVAIFHCYEFSMPHINQYIGLVLRRLNIGVDIFLILSGIGVFVSLANDNNIVSFYKKRFIRSIFPTIILTIIYIFVNNTIFDTNNSLAQYVYRIFGLSFWFDGDRIIWFIALITLLYLISPILYNLSQNHKLLLALRLCTFSAIILNFYLCYQQYSFYQKTEIAIGRLLPFILGCYFGEQLIDESKTADNIYTKKAYEDILFIITLGVFFLLLSTITSKPTRTVLYRMGSVASSAIISILFCYFMDKSNFNHLKNVLKFFGNISLEFYLILVFIRYIWIDLSINNNLINATKLFILSTILAYMWKITYCKISNLFFARKNRKC